MAKTSPYGSLSARVTRLLNPWGGSWPASDRGQDVFVLTPLDGGR
jgi:hypothetical protein